MLKTELERLIKEYEQSLWFFQREDARIALLKKFLEENAQQLLSDDEEISFGSFQAFLGKDKKKESLFTEDYLQSQSESAVVFRQLLYKRKEEKSQISGKILKKDLSDLIAKHEKSKWFFQRWFGSDERQIQLLKQFMKEPQNKGAEEISYSAFLTYAGQFLDSATFNSLFSEKYIYSGSRGANVILKFKAAEAPSSSPEVHESKRSPKPTKQSFLDLGCDKDLFDALEAVNSKEKIIDLKKLYDLFEQLPEEYRRGLVKSDLWQILCLYGEPKAIQYGIDQGIITSDKKNKLGENPLHLIAESGSVSGAKWLMKHVNGIDPKSVTAETAEGELGYLNPLTKAALRNQVDFVNYAAESLGNDPAKMTDDQLYEIAKRGNFGVIKLLLEKFKIALNDEEKEFIFRNAVRSGNIDFVIYLIKRFSLDSQKIITYGGLPEAAAYGHKSIMGYFYFELRVDPNAVDPRGGQSALYCAIKGNRLESVKKLNDLGVSIKDSHFFGSSAIELAIEEQVSPEMLAYLTTFLPDEKVVASNLFFMAAKKGNQALMDTLKNLSDPYWKDEFSKTALHLAYEEKDKAKQDSLMKFLLTDLKLEHDKFLGANGRTVLHLAVERDDLEMVKKLITEYKVNPNQVDALGKSALDYAGDRQRMKDALIGASREGSEIKADAVHASASVAASLSPQPTVEDDAQATERKKQETKEWKASGRTLKKAATVFIERERRDSEEKVAQERRTQLIQAIQRNELHEIKQAIEAKTLTPETTLDNQGKTALHYAAEHGAGNVLNYLLKECKWDPHVFDQDRKTPLKYAIKRGMGDIHIIDGLVTHGAKYVDLDDDILETYKNRKQELQTFIEGTEANLTQYLVKKFNPNLGKLLFAAIENADEKMIDRLLKLGKVNPHEKIYDMTPLLFAIEKKNKALAKLLLEEYKSDPNVKDGGGRNALHYAVLSGDAELVQLVRAYGAKTVKDNESFSPSDLDNAKKNPDIKKALKVRVPPVKASQVRSSTFTSVGPGDVKDAIQKGQEKRKSK